MVLFANSQKEKTSLAYTSTHTQSRNSIHQRMEKWTNRGMDGESFVEHLAVTAKLVIEV